MTECIASDLNTILIGDVRFYLDPSGALWQLDESILIVADLHLEKGSSLAKRRSTLLPPYDTRTTLMRLDEVITRFHPKTVITLGDTWHDDQAPERLADEDRAQLSSLMSRTKFIFISGNHDPEPRHHEPFQIVQELALRHLVLRHEPQIGAQFEISGHLHPVAKIKGRGRVLRRRCFIANERRIILPAFGAYTGGLNVCDKAFTPLFPDQNFRVHLLSDDRTYAAGAAQLLPD